MNNRSASFQFCANILRRSLIFSLLLVTTYTFSQTFPKLKELSTGQGKIGDLDPNWMISEYISSNQVPTNPNLYNYTKALINNNCAPGSWVDPSSLPFPVNNGNWITSQGESCNRTGIPGGFRFFRLTLNLPKLCNGIDLNLIYKINFSGFVDDVIENVYVNGIPKNIKGGGYTQNNKIDFQVNDSWKPGMNYIDVLLRNAESGDPNGLNPYGLLLVADIIKSSSSDLDNDGIVDINDLCPCDKGSDITGCISDTDKDGISDEDDIDDDNDGVLDEVECPTAQVSQSFETQGGFNTIFDAPSADNGFQFKVYSLDNSFNLNINGIDLVTDQIQCWNNVTTGESQLIFVSDNTGYGDSGNSNVWEIQGSFQNPVIQLVVNPDGNVFFYGKRNTNASLERMIIRPGHPQSNKIFWNSKGSNTIILTQKVVGPTFIKGEGFGLINCIQDTDGDGIVNRLDLDSDGDGCSDAFESSSTLDKSKDYIFSGPYSANGLADRLETANESGVVIYSSTYSTNALDNTIKKCSIIDTDKDGISDEDDIDDDNDGVLDVTEKYPNCEKSEVFNWINWTTISDKEAIGEININGKKIIATVSHSVGGLFQTNGMFNGTIFPSQYTVPISNSSIANSLAGVFKIKFSEPVSNPIFAFASIGNSGLTVPVQTSSPYSIIWNGEKINYLSPTEFQGSEGYNIIQISQISDEFTFVYKTGETYCNIAFGVKDIINCSGDFADTDNDGIPNYLDTDSDGDGCSDAFESSATIDKTSNYTFSSPFGANGYYDKLETLPESGIINYNSTYATNAINSFISNCGIEKKLKVNIINNDTLLNCNSDSLKLEIEPCTLRKWKDKLVFFYNFNGGLNDIFAQSDTKNNVQLTPDRFGKNNCAALFNGINSFIQTNSSGNILPLTIAAQIYSNDFSGEHSIIDSDVGGSFGNSLMVGYQNKDRTPDVQYHNGYISYDNTILEKKWYHLTAIIDKNYVKLYIDGQLVKTQNYSAAFPLDGELFRIGRHNLNDPQWFNGVMDDAGVWNRVLCDDEILELSKSDGLPSDNEIIWSTGQKTVSIKVLPKSKTKYYVDLIQLNQKVTDSVFVDMIGRDSITVYDTLILCTSQIPFKWQNQTITKSGTFRAHIISKTSCIDSIINLTLFINNFKAGSDVKICLGESLKLNASGGVSYQWDNNVVNGVLFSPTKSARYTVTATDANGCKDTSSLFILVNPLPSVNAGNDTNICVGTPAILKAKGALTYSWNKGIENAKSFYPIANTSYEVTGIDINGCKNTDQVEISLNSNPEFILSVNEPCEKSKLQFTVELDSKTATVGVKKTSWLGPNGFSSLEQNVSISDASISRKGNYSLEIVDNNNCKTTKNIFATISPEDSIVFQNLEEKCVNSPSFKLPITNIPGGIWTSSDKTSIINAVDGIFDPAKSKPNQDKIVEVTYSTASILPARKCPSQATKSIVLNPIPDSTFSVVNAVICEEDMVEFKINNPNPNATYYWDFGDGLTASGLNPNHIYYKIGFMDVKLVSFLGKCQVSQTRKALVNVIAKPINVDFSQNVSEIDYYYPVVEFTTNTKAKYYEWHFGDYQTSKVKNPSHTFPTIPGEYIIKLHVFNMENHCDASVEHKILMPEPTIYFVPNSFTPNGDEVNNIFLPIITSGFDPKKYSFYIFNRWGALVFESHDVNVGWDGTFGNKILPSDIYIWKLEFTEKMTERRHAKEGVVNLIR